MYSTEIFQEGVRLPPTQVVRGGQPMEDIWTIIEAHVTDSPDRPSVT